LTILWSIFHSMETIQVVLDSELLRATNGAAKRARVNRSSLIREALREYIKRLRACEIEARDRQGYRRRPDAAGDAAAWERVASWPER
jgi:predicted transcriptional regulator